MGHAQAGKVGDISAKMGEDMGLMYLKGVALLSSFPQRPRSLLGLYCMPVGSTSYRTFGPTTPLRYIRPHILTHLSRDVPNLPSLCMAHSQSLVVVGFPTEGHQ